MSNGVRLLLRHCYTFYFANFLNKLEYKLYDGINIELRYDMMATFLVVFCLTVSIYCNILSHHPMFIGQDCRVNFIHIITGEQNVDIK